MDYAAEKINKYIENNNLKELVDISESRHNVQYDLLLKLIEESHPKCDDFVGADFYNRTVCFWKNHFFKTA